MNSILKIIALALALFIIVSVVALVCLSYLSSRGIDALPVIQLLDAMYESASQGREVEFTP